MLSYRQKVDQALETLALLLRSFRLRVKYLYNTDSGNATKAALLTHTLRHGNDPTF